MHEIGRSGNDDDWLRFIVQNFSEIVTVAESDGTLRYTSPAFGRILEYDPGKVSGKNVFDFVHPDDLSRVLEGDLAVMCGLCRLLDETKYLLPKPPAACPQAANILARSNSNPARP